MKEFLYNFESEAKSIGMEPYDAKDKTEKDCVDNNLVRVYTFPEDQDQPIGIDYLKKLMNQRKD